VLDRNSSCLLFPLLCPLRVRHRLVVVWEVPLSGEVQLHQLLQLPKGTQLDLITDDFNCFEFVDSALYYPSLTHYCRPSSRFNNRPFVTSAVQVPPRLKYDACFACSIIFHTQQLPLIPPSNKLKQQHEQDKIKQQQKQIGKNVKSSTLTATNVSSAPAPTHSDKSVAWIRPKSNLQADALWRIHYHIFLCRKLLCCSRF
jgi:hypothetical protein